MLVEAFETVFPSHDFGWRQSGSSSLGFCPFHNDKHQRSLSIYLNDRGEECWHCFAESIGGGLIDIVKRSGIPDTTSSEGANYWLVQHGFIQETEQQVAAGKRSRALREFWKWTNALLMESPEAAGLRSYIAGRHINVRTIPFAPIGYYPTVNEVEQWLHEHNYYELLESELIPERRHEPMVTGSLLMFYRHSYEEFGRIKIRNVFKEKEGNKVTMFLGRKLTKKESSGYFSWNMQGSPSEDAILVEGEFDVGALTSLVYDYDDSAVEPIYCFSGGGNLNYGIGILTNMGKKNLYVMPDNDDAGMDYAYKLADAFPQTFIIVPHDYKENDDPASWAADHTFDDLQAAYNARTPAFGWIGTKLADLAKDATIEEQSTIKTKLITYAKKLRPIDRELFLKSYGAISGVSLPALIEEVEDNSEIRYRKVLNESGYGIQMRIDTKNGTNWEQISNIIMETERDILLDAGDEDVERKIVLRVSLSTKSERLELTPDEYADDKKLYSSIVRLLGSRVWVKPRCMSFIRESCNLLSRNHLTDIPEELIYTHTGWRGERYISPTGFINADGFHKLNDVKVELPENPAYMRNYYLDDPPADLDFVKKLIREEVLKVFPYRVTLPYLAHIFWSPLAHFVPMAKPICLWVVGLTGSFKTSYTGLMASFFGNFKTGDFETWRSTTNAIEKNGYFVKDMPFVVDDYKGVDINQKALTSCIQNYGDRHGRGRMRADLNVGKTWYIRGNMISTAEDIPQGEASVLSRILLLKIPGRGDSGHLTKAQANANLLPGLTSKYIQFLCQRKLREHDYEAMLAERRTKFRAFHGRVAESLAANSIAWDAAAEFLGLEDLTSEYNAALQEILQTMNLSTRDEQAGFVFTATVGELLQSGQCFLEGYNGADDTEHPEGAKRIGWVTPNNVYLLGSLALAEVNKFRILMTGAPLKYTAGAIYDQLIHSGHVQRANNGNPTTIVKINKQAVRVLNFKRGVLEHYDEAPANSIKLDSGIVRDQQEGTEKNDLW
jgi:hypothetical protein